LQVSRSRRRSRLSASSSLRSSRSGRHQPCI
jgi:hypothetical protein